MRRLIAFLFTGALLLSIPPLFAAGTGWVDQGGKVHRPKEQVQKKKTVALRNNLKDAADYLADDLMKRYPGSQKEVYLAPAAFVLTTNGQRTRASNDLEVGVAKRLEKTGKFLMLDAKETLNLEAKLYEKRKRLFRNDVFYYKKVGRTMGAEVLMNGTISVGNKYVGVSASLIDVETERVLSVSQVYIPKDRVSADVVAWGPYKAPKDPYRMIFRWRVKPEFDLVNAIENQLLKQAEKDYKVKGGKEDELMGDTFQDAVDPTSIPQPEPAEGEVVEVEDMDGTGEDVVYEETAPVEEEPAPEEDVIYEEPTPAAEGAVAEGEATPTDGKADPKKSGKKVNKFMEDNIVEVFECHDVETAQNIQIAFRANQDGFAYLFSIDGNGRVKQLYPMEQNKQWAQKVFKDRGIILDNALSTRAGCQRVCAIVADQPFKLNVDTSLLRRLSCSQAEVDLPWVKSLPPNIKYQQRTLCFQQKITPKIGEETPTPTLEESQKMALEQNAAPVE